MIPYYGTRTPYSYLGKTADLLRAFPRNVQPISREVFPLDPWSREHYGDP